MAVGCLAIFQELNFGKKMPGGNSFLRAFFNTLI
jgi:hypothetical protein